MVTVRCCPDLEGGLGELKVLDELNVTQSALRLCTLLALLVLGSLRQPGGDGRLARSTVDDICTREEGRGRTDGDRAGGSGELELNRRSDASLDSQYGALQGNNNQSKVISSATSQRSGQTDSR